MDKEIIEKLRADLMKLPEDVRQELLAPYAEKYGGIADGRKVTESRVLQTA